MFFRRFVVTIFSFLLVVSCFLLTFADVITNNQSEMKKTIALLALLISCSCAIAQKKSVSILGDSYSTYEGYMTPSTNELWYYGKATPQTTDVSNVRQTWWYQLIKQKNWRLCVNNSYSGATISYTGYAGNDYSARSFNTRADNLGSPDVILIFGATNDSWAGTPVGDYKYENITYGDLYTFRPAMARLLDYVTTRYVGSEVYFLINDGLRPDITESIKTVCRHYDVPFVELHDIHKISGHPSVQGMTQIAQQVAAAVK